MPRRIPAIVLTAVLLIPATALAREAVSQEKAAQPAASAQPATPAQPAANLATAAKAVMNPVGTVGNFNQSIRESEKQTQAAVEAMNQAESKSAPSAPAPRPGGGKVIYGDIVIHK